MHQTSKRPRPGLLYQLIRQQRLLDQVHVKDRQKQERVGTQTCQVSILWNIGIPPSESGSEGQSIGFSPNQKGTHEVIGLRSDELASSTDINFTEKPKTRGDELSSILEELEESIYRSHSQGLPLDLGKEGSSNLDPTTLVLATELSTPLGGQRRQDSSNHTLLFDLVVPQTTGGPSGTVRSQRVPEVRDPEDYRTALDMSAKAREPIFFLGRLKKTHKFGLNALKNSVK